MCTKLSNCRQSQLNCRCCSYSSRRNIIIWQPLLQVLDDIYLKIVEPLHADVYIVSSDERWVRFYLSITVFARLQMLTSHASQRDDKKSFPETDDAGKVLMEQWVICRFIKIQV